MSLEAGFGLITAQRFPGEPGQAVALTPDIAELGREVEACLRVIGGRLATTECEEVRAIENAHPVRPRERAPRARSASSTRAAPSSNSRRSNRSRQ